MYELQTKSNGERILVFSGNRRPGERGIWERIGHENEKSINFVVDFNRRNGMQVEKDENGYYRIFILKD